MRLRTADHDLHSGVHGGVALNPLHVLVRMFSQVLHGPDGRLRQAAEPERRRVVAPATADTLAEMLVRVVEEGTVARARVPGYAVAGKTGTAQKPSETSRGYADGA